MRFFSIKSCYKFTGEPELGEEGEGEREKRREEEKEGEKGSLS